MNMRLQHQYFNSTGVHYTHWVSLYLGRLGCLRWLFCCGGLGLSGCGPPSGPGPRGAWHPHFWTLQQNEPCDFLNSANGHITIRFPFSNPIQFTIILNHASKTLPVVFNLANKHECTGTGTGTCYRVPVPNVRYNMFKFNICRACIWICENTVRQETMQTTHKYRPPMYTVITYMHWN